ncbi:MAG TPA: cation diffusion facilitator family transporter [Candidatus Eisenbergiella pullicola]|nr:cation diffusion facilitator family transporter [Candidatus Eisenbergiella pullicola]
MITFLTRLLIKNSQDTKNPAVRQAYGTLCGAAGIGFNLLLFAGKAIAGLLSNSISIMADAFNNLSDAGSSIITLVGFRMSGQEPDPDHPFGHGRIEYLAGLIVSGIILLMAAELIKSSVSKILHPEELTFSPVIVAILAASILVKLYMYSYNRKIAAAIDSAAMKATATDSLSDSLATLAVLLATLADHFTGLHIDGWCGLLVGLFICRAGISAARDTINPLLGQPPEKEFVEQIRRIVLSHPDVLGMHDLIVHNYGPGRVMISLHAEVSAKGDILRLHDTIDNIERELQKQLRCNAVIHMDPIENDDAETEKQKKAVLAILAEIDPNITMHDFRIVQGPTHTNLIFDVMIPYGFQISDAQLKSRIESEIRKKNPEYYAVINIDKDYM